MDVSIRIKNIEISENYDTIEFVYKNACSVVHDVINFTILTLHDFLFEKVILRLKSRGKIWDKYLGVIFLQLSAFKNCESVNQVERVLSGEYSFRADFYDLKGLQVIGKCTYDYKIRFNEQLKNVNSQEHDNFVQSMFNLFVNPQKSVLLANFKSVIDDFLDGTSSCKVNFVLGAYFIENYTADIHYKMSKNLTFSDINKLKKLKVHKKKMNYQESIYKLEKFIFGPEYSFEYSDIQDFTKFHPVSKKDQKDDSILNDESNGFIEKDYEGFLGIFDVLFQKQVNKNQILLTLEESMTNMIKDDNIDFFTKHTQENFVDDKFFHSPNNKLTIQEVLSNDGYIIANQDFLQKLVNYFYYAVGSYGNSWATAFCKKRTTLSTSLDVDSNRRAILEFLDIDNSRLLSIQMAEDNIPEHIIFFDKDNNRLVISFKGTSTSDEALQDLNCRYTKFYEGYAHKGIKNMACEFVKRKTKEILDLAESNKTKNILLTGHSLGASIAILVHLIYKRHDITKLLNINTVAFSAAPVVSFNLANIIYKDIYVISYGNDFVPRLNYGSFSELKYACCSLGSNSGYLTCSLDIDENIFKIRNFTQKNNKYPKLYCPGINYHFKRINGIKESKKVSLIVYKEVGLEFFESMVVIKHATLHHMLPHLLGVFEKCISDWDEVDND